MKIVIAGAGAVGTHLAKLLSQEHQDVILMDIDNEKLAKAQTSAEMMTFEGDSTSIKDLMEVDTPHANLFVAVTEIESSNILACILAKRLGAKHTFARIDNYEYLLPKHKEMFEELGIDSMVYPEMLAAKEIVTAIKHPWVRSWMELCNGSIMLVGVKVREKSMLIDKYLHDFIGGQKKLHVVAIKRKNVTIIPRGNDHIELGDILFFTTTKEYSEEIPRIAGRETFEIKNLMIMGGSRIAIRTCQYLPDNINIKLIESDREKCEALLDKLPKNVTVFHNDGRDTDFLQQEGIQDMDAFIAVTGSSEANIMACVAAKRLNVKKTVAEVENMEYIPMAESLDIGTIVNKKLITVNNIHRILLNADVSNVKTLMVANADVAEIIAKPNSYVTKKEVKNLRFPEDVTIGGLIRNGEAILVDGDTQIEPYDLVVVFCLDDSLVEAEKLFQ